MGRTTIREAAGAERPLVTPLAHDALSARLIQRAGFRAFAVGGSAMLAARYGLPDLGLIGLTDMADGLRDIAAASDLPFLADGDDGYGDIKAVVRMVETYEALGVGAILIEDQVREKKQQRADSARGVADEAAIAQKLRVAMDVRRSPDTWIIGRTDAYGLLGLDAALKRAEQFLELGVDGVFVAGLRKAEDYERVGRTLKGAFLSAAMFEGGETPWLTPAVLGEMGFGHVSFPAALILRVAAALDAATAGLRAYVAGDGALPPLPDYAVARAALDAGVTLDRWRQVEAAHG